MSINFTSRDPKRLYASDLDTTAAHLHHHTSNCLRLAQCEWLKLPDNIAQSTHSKQLWIVLKGLTQLRSLDLRECLEITDAGIAHLKGLTHLWRSNRRGNVT